MFRCAKVCVSVPVQASSHTHTYTRACAPTRMHVHVREHTRTHTNANNCVFVSIHDVLKNSLTLVRSIVMVECPKFPHGCDRSSPTHVFNRGNFVHLLIDDCASCRCLLSLISKLNPFIKYSKIQQTT